MASENIMMDALSSGAATGRSCMSIRVHSMEAGRK